MRSSNLLTNIFDRQMKRIYKTISTVRVVVDHADISKVILMNNHQEDSFFSNEHYLLMMVSMERRRTKNLLIGTVQLASAAFKGFVGKECEGEEMWGKQHLILCLPNFKWSAPAAAPIVRGLKSYDDRKGHQPEMRTKKMLTKFVQKLIGIYGIL